MAGHPHACPSGSDVADLAHAERLALWSLRQAIRHDPPRCPMAPRSLSWGLGGDLERVDAAFRRALDQIAPVDRTYIRLGSRGSLGISEDEVLLLRCLAALQLGRDEPGDLLRTILPDGRSLDLFADALSVLAAALASCVHWLSAPATRPRVPATAAWTPRQYVAHVAA